MMRVAFMDLWLRYHAGLYLPVGCVDWTRDVLVV